jgi:DNA-binding NarL/FixJ family response regulator
MMRDILDGVIGSEQDLDVVGHFDTDDLLASVEQYAPDVVITRADCMADGDLLELLIAHPQLKLVVLSEDESSARLLDLRETHLIDPSPTLLIATIRAVLRREG